MVLNRLLGKNEELTLIFIKPDAMRSSDVGEICSMLSRKNPYFAGARLVSMSKELCLEHYDTAFKDWKKDNKTEDEPPFKESVLRYMLGLHHYTDDDPARGRVLAVAFHGNDIIKKVKELVGPTDPEKAKKDYPTSIRAKYGSKHPIEENDKPILDEDGKLVYLMRNAIHASANRRDAQREIKLFMEPRDLHLPWRDFYATERLGNEFFYILPGKREAKVKLQDCNESINKFSVISQYQDNARLIAGPHNQIWKSDLDNLRRFRDYNPEDKKSRPNQSLLSIILKYEQLLPEELTWK